MTRHTHPLERADAPQRGFLADPFESFREERGASSNPRVSAGDLATVELERELGLSSVGRVVNLRMRLDAPAAALPRRRDVVIL